MKTVLVSGFQKVPGSAIPWFKSGKKKDPNRLTLAQKSGFWKLTAWGYEKFWRLKSLGLLTGNRITVSEELRILSGYLSALPENPAVCDLTCSTGLYGRTVLETVPGSRIYFLDASPAMLAGTAKSIREGDYGRVILAEAFCEDPVFLPESLDAVICGGSWNEITAVMETVNQTFLSLKPGGLTFWMGILPAVSRFGKLFQRLAVLFGGLRFDPESRISEQFKLAGFEEIRIFSVAPVFILTAKKPGKNG
ncbi:MAG: class I SAM-dependent methyltransferase [Bacteroidetes bacterium]|nr:class I SAM-dependent methyltransferase [Bacteroidota bacterium]